MSAEERERLLALLTEAREALKGIRSALNASFGAGTEEREGGSGSRQGKQLDYVRQFETKANATLSRIDALLAAAPEARA